MQAYFFSHGHPKFASVLKAKKKSGSQKKEYRTKALSQFASMSNTESSQKQPSAAIVSSQCPVGREGAKKMKAREFVIDKVARGIAKAIAPQTPQSVNYPAMNTLEEGFSKANDIMQTMVYYQVVSMAPQDIRDCYFAEVFDLINVQARNRRLCLQVENEELLHWIRKIEKEKQKIEMNAKMTAVLTDDEVDNYIKEEVVTDEDDDDVSSVVTADTLKCH